MKWIKAKDKLPKHRESVMFSPKGSVVHEAVFFETYVCEQAEDLKNVFRINSGTLFHWHELPEADFQWQKKPNPPKR